MEVFAAGPGGHRAVPPAEHRAPLVAIAARLMSALDHPPKPHHAPVTEASHWRHTSALGDSLCKL